jgi:plasmid stabilization system protein ParE
MANFEVSFQPEAIDDILASYEWGVDRWGEFAAEKWLRELYLCIFDRLTVFPSSCPFAPENDFLEGEIRQLVFLRYRIIYEIQMNLVIVLKVDGPFKKSY